MEKLLIFDLDNTLFDTYNQVSKHVLDDMLARMRQAGLTEEQERILREKYAFTGFKIIAKQLGLNDDVIDIGMKAYLYMDLSKIKPFKDVKIIPKLPGRKMLVTSGVPEIQQKKVDLLKIREYFEEVIIDDSNSPENKQRIFRKLIIGMKPADAIVIGDNPDSELLAGKNLGMTTVQIVRHEGMTLAGASYTIRTLDELKKIIGT
jgi:FMN phosphatase YigB (HAD superfamily)